MIITRHLCCRLQRQISYGLDVNSQMDALNRLKLKKVFQPRLNSIQGDSNHLDFSILLWSIRKDSQVVLILDDRWMTRNQRAKRAPGVALRRACGYVRQATTRLALVPIGCDNRERKRDSRRFGRRDRH